MARFLGFVMFVAAGLSAAPALAADVGAGKSDFSNSCAMCHGAAANSAPGIGPRLFGVVGRRSGSLPGYSYSTAMKNANVTWTAEQLESFLTDPQAAIHGNKMPFPGIRDAKQRSNVIAYLETLR